MFRTTVCGKSTPISRSHPWVCEKRPPKTGLESHSFTLVFLEHTFLYKCVYNLYNKLLAEREKRTENAPRNAPVHRAESVIVPCSQMASSSVHYKLQASTGFLLQMATINFEIGFITSQRRICVQHIGKICVAARLQTNLRWGPAASAANVATRLVADLNFKASTTSNACAVHYVGVYCMPMSPPDNLDIILAQCLCR